MACRLNGILFRGLQGKDAESGIKHHVLGFAVDEQRDFRPSVAALERLEGGLQVLPWQCFADADTLFGIVYDQDLALKQVGSDGSDMFFSIGKKVLFAEPAAVVLEVADVQAIKRSIAHL